MTEPTDTPPDRPPKSQSANPLAHLEERIAAAKRAQEPGPRQDEHYSQAQLAWRMVIELVAGLGIGFAIGYGLDGLLGSQPILMVVFTLLGLAAGIKTMMRSASEVQAKQAAMAVDDNTAGADAPADEDRS